MIVIMTGAGLIIADGHSARRRVLCEEPDAVLHRHCRLGLDWQGSQRPRRQERGDTLYSGKQPFF